METFLLVLRALRDAGIELTRAHFEAALLPGGHRIELTVAHKEQVERVLDETRRLGLDPVVLAPRVSYTIAIDTTLPAE